MRRKFINQILNFMKKILTIIPVVAFVYCVSWSVFSQNQNQNETQFSGVTRDLNANSVSRADENIKVQAVTNSAIVDSVSIDEIYTLGQVPDPYGLPDTICVYYQKKYHGFPKMGLQFTFKNYFTNVTYSDTIIILSDTSIHSGTYCLRVPQITASLSDYNSQAGNNFSRGPSIATKNPLIDIVQAVHGDTAIRFPPPYNDDPTNNSMERCNFITYGSYNFSTPCESDNGGVGFTGVTGNILAGFRNQTGSPYIINSIVHNFYEPLGRGNHPYKIIIHADDGTGKPGSQLYLSPVLTSPPGANSSVQVIHTLPSPLSIPGNSKFYIGVRQTSTTNTGMSYQNENPVRSKSFFYSTPDNSTSWTDFSTVGNNYCLDISAVSQNNVNVSPNSLNYATLTAAFAAIQLGTHGATPTVTITASFTETSATGAILTNNAPTAITSVRIYTAGTFTVTGATTVAAPIMTFNDIDNSTIDGRVGQTGTTNALTFNHLNTTSGLIGVLNLSNGCSGNTIKWCNCTTLSLNGRMINVAQSTAALGGNNNNTIDHCVMDGGSRAIQTFGTAGVNTNDNTTITNNKVTNANTLGIFVGSELIGVNCSNNDVSITRAIGAGLVNYRGISIQGGGTINCNANNVHNLTNTTAGNTYTFIGIISIPQPITTGSTSYVINFVNNCVTLMDNNLASGFIYGLFPATNGTSPACTQNVYNNTCRLGGTGLVTATNAVFDCLPISVVAAGSTVKSYNNVCSYERSANNTTSFGIAYDLTSYPAPGVTLNSDYNNGNAYANTFGWDGGYGNFVYQNAGIEQYKDSTCSVSIEQHTSFDSLLFAGTNSCVLATGTVGGNMNGKTGLSPAVTTDIFGTARNATYPYRGAYEGPALKVFTLTAALEGKSSGIGSANPPVNLVLYQGCVGKATCYVELNIGTNSGVATFGDAITNGGGGYQLAVRSINHLRTWSSSSSVVFTAGTGSYNFTDLITKAFGSNQAGSSAPFSFYGGDINQDGTIDITDLGLIDNDAFNFLSGCRISTDVNSDGTVDVTDGAITDNNVSNFVSEVSPCPAPTSVVTSNVKNVGTVTSRKAEVITNGF